MELIGKCKNCLGCNKLENEKFNGIYRCENTTTKQVEIEQIRKELLKHEVC